MRKPSSYQQTLDRLKTVGSREHATFESAVASLRGRDDYAETVADARAALDALVSDPDLFSSRRASCGGGGASLLMGALGFRPLVGTRYEYVGLRTPVTLRRLELASKALASFADEEPARRAAARFDGLPPEPPLGAAGTTTLLLLPSRDRRRYAADDPLAKVVPWVRVAGQAPGASAVDLELVHPPSAEALCAADERKTLQALGLWPSATLRLRGADAPAPAPAPAKATVKKPKPSDLFKRVKNRFDPLPPRAAPSPA